MKKKRKELNIKTHSQIITLSKKKIFYKNCVKDFKVVYIINTLSTRTSCSLIKRMKRSEKQLKKRSIYDIMQ